MKILVVCQYYYPEPFRIHEVCEELVQRGHEVTVLTGLPNYPMGIIPDEYKGKNHRDEVVNKVHIIRVSEIPRSQGKIGLAKNYVSFVINGSLKAITMKKDFDVIFVYQLSPILMAIPAYVAKWFSRTKHIVLYCLDLWPESLVSLGISKVSPFFKLVKWVSKRIYNGAYSICYTSEMFKEYFEKELKVFNKRFEHVSQFADELFTQVSNVRRAGSDNINYVFAGNIGEMQAVETIIKAAALTTNDKIKWHIVGDGSKLEDCKRVCTQMGLDDKVIFYGRLPVERMPEFYNMADAMVVTLAKNDTISYTLPGKVQSYMAASKPVLASADGETYKVIKKAECGMCARAEDEVELAKMADEMAKSDLIKMGINSKTYYDTYFSKKSHIDQIEKMLLDASK